jgi:adenylate cyclase
MQRGGDRLRVSFNLLQTSDGASLWTDQFDLNFTEIFGLQDKVARQVVERLRYRISAAEQARIAKQHTTNPQAYEYYVKATFYFADRSVFPEERGLLDRANELFRKAIELDPNYSLAHARLGHALAYMASWFEDNPALLASARRELELAEKLDPQLAEIHIARSIIYWSRYEGYDFAQAIRAARRAQQLDPGAGHFELAEFYGHLGFPEWQGEIERALELDPTSEMVKDQVVSLYHINCLPEEMLAARRRIYNLGPNAIYYLTKRMEKEAAPLVEEMGIAQICTPA